MSPPVTPAGFSLVTYIANNRMLIAPTAGPSVAAMDNANVQSVRAIRLTVDPLEALR